jgi:hypothetical protein
MKRFFHGLVMSLGFALACSTAGAQSLTAAQSGSGNAAFARQGPGEVFGIIVQTGNNNRVGDPVAQTGGLVQLDSRGPAGTEIYQIGDHNRANAIQLDVERAVVSVIQTGDGNAADLAGETLRNSNAFVTQDGHDNALTIRRARLSIFDAVINQNGTGNRAKLVQQDSTLDGARITQLGDGHAADVSQVGGNELASVDIAQSGALHDASVVQDGVQASTASIFQTGSGNTMSVIQR